MSITLLDPKFIKKIVLEEIVDFFMVLFEKIVMFRQNTMDKKFNSYIAITVFSFLPSLMQFYEQSPSNVETKPKSFTLFVFNWFLHALS